MTTDDFIYIFIKIKKYFFGSLDRQIKSFINESMCSIRYTCYIKLDNPVVGEY